ncbi:MAG: amidohydrolase [candidate division KSB1 bacterium]|nr:amidohydrolase [candidate division KSB1 bacterium]
MRLMVLFGIMTAMIAAFACQRGPKVADLVFKNGTIYTVDDQFRTAEAVAVVQARIAFVGSNADVQAWIDDGTQVIDLQGKTLVPGFIDAHYHYLGVGKREYHLNLDGTRSLQEFLSRIKAEAEKTPKGQWITGRGWIEEDWPTKRFPTRQDLDRVAPDHPVFLTRADGHAAVVNSLALKIAGITAATPDPQGGQILKDRRTGHPTGMLLDRAMALVRKHLPPDTTFEMQRNYALKANEIALAYGITQVHDMGVTWDVVDLYKKLYESNELAVRIHAYIRGPGEDADRLLNEGPQIGLFDHHLTVRGIKIVADGALGSRGAALLRPYSDQDTHGFLIYKDEEIYPTIKKATEAGIQMAIHAIGDSANRKVLDLYEKAFADIPASRRKLADPRFRIEHAQIVALDDMPRFAKLGVIPSMQPSHAIGDLHFAVRRLGLDRMTEGYAWRTFIDLGCYIPGGSDAPVEEGNPMIEFYAACVRKDTSGYSGEGWHPELRMTREEALRCLTIWASKAVFEEDIKGSIEVGKLADFVVLDRNLMTEPEERLFDIKVMMTVIDGKIVFERKP